MPYFRENNSKSNGKKKVIHISKRFSRKFFTGMCNKRISVSKTEKVKEFKFGELCEPCVTKLYKTNE